LIIINSNWGRLVLTASRIEK